MRLPPGVWEWVALRRAWGQVEQTAKTNLFSKVGVGARDAAIVLRRQAITLHNALRWRGAAPVSHLHHPAGP